MRAGTQRAAASSMRTFATSATSATRPKRRACSARGKSRPPRSGNAEMIAIVVHAPMSGTTTRSVRRSHAAALPMARLRRISRKLLAMMPGPAITKPTPITLRTLAALTRPPEIATTAVNDKAPIRPASASKTPITMRGSMNAVAAGSARPPTLDAAKMPSRSVASGKRKLRLPVKARSGAASPTIRASKGLTRGRLPLKPARARLRRAPR